MSTQPPFVIFGLPRSRTAWLARFLTHGGHLCGHDQLRYCRSLDDVRSWLSQPQTGSVETAAAPFWRLLPKLQPDVHIITIRRPVADVVASMMALGLGFDAATLTREMRQMDAKLDQIEARMPNVLSLSYDALRQEDTCAVLYERCLGRPHDPDWWEACASVNIQIDMRQLIRFWHAHKPQLVKLTKIAKQQMLAGMGRGGLVEGVTFQLETFDEGYPDARECLAEHLVQTGQAPDDYSSKNIGLMRLLDSLGNLQVMTARSRNGRMMGYLMTVIGPSLDDPKRVEGHHTIFYASPDVRNLGMKLQRNALAALKARGVDDVIMRAGHRGSGPRLGTFYRRLGAEPFGELYKLDIGEMSWA